MAPVVPPTASIEAHGGRVPILDPIEGEHLQSQSAESPANDRKTLRGDASGSGKAKLATSRYDMGTALWLLERISQLRSAPKDRVLQEVSKRPGEEQVVLLSPEQVVKEQERRNREILQLAQEAVVKTHHDPEQVKLFNSALDALSEARLQLAIGGDMQQARLLESDAEQLFESDPTSFAAVESSFRVLKFSQTQAQRLSSQDQKWAVAYSNQARLFAERFPAESSRAAIHLLAAGKMCDNLSMRELAQSCFKTIELKFPGSPYAEQVIGIQRRLRLPGQHLSEFAGSTLNGGHVDIKSFRGSPVLVMFWASNSETFQKDVPRIQDIVQRSGGRLCLIGVNLDRDELRAGQYANESFPASEHIFYSDHNKRGSRNVIAEYYGVEKIPSYWLIDSQGVVTSVDQPVEHLEPAVAELLTGARGQAEQRADNVVAPVTFNQQ